MTATCDHTHTHITTEPQHITLVGNRTKVDFNITVNAKCRNGHAHTLYLVDLADADEACRLQAEWAGEHVDTCPGPDSTEGTKT